MKNLMADGESFDPRNAASGIVNAFLRGDVKSLDRIMASVPSFTGTVENPEFTMHRMQVLNALYLWLVEAWKMRYQLMTNWANFFQNRSQMTDAQINTAICDMRAIEKAIVTDERAMEMFCARYKIDSAAVLDFGDLKPFVPSHKGVVCDDKEARRLFVDMELIVEGQPRIH